MVLAPSSRIKQAPTLNKRLGYSLGNILLESGLVNEDQLQCALEEQAEAAKDGKHVLLGKIFVSWGLISQAELDGSIRKLSRRDECSHFGTAVHASVINKGKWLLDIVGALVGLCLSA
jgi:hypothetical protein